MIRVRLHLYLGGTSVYDYKLLGGQHVRLHCVHDRGSDCRQSMPGLLLMNATTLCVFHFNALRCVHSQFDEGLSQRKGSVPCVRNLLL